jgi:hypothetical protein
MGTWPEGFAAREENVARKARLVLALIMSAAMAFMVTLLVTFINLGLRRDFVFLWLKAYLIAWPIAAATAYLFMPVARRLTDRLVGQSN